MLKLRDVLELVVDRFDQGTFAKQQLVEYRHENIFHIFLDLRDELDIFVPKKLEELFGKISFITDELSRNTFRQFVHQLFISVIHIARCKDEVQNITKLIDDQMQLEPVKPSCRTLTPLGQSFEHFVLVNTPAVADDDRH